MATDVSTVTNHFPKPQDGFTTTTSGSVSSGGTTVGLNSTGNYSNGDIFVGIIEPGDSNKKQAFTGVIDTGGVQVTGVKWTSGTNQSHASGVTVVDYVAATHLQMMTKGILVEHNQDGTHDKTLITSRSSATPADGDSIVFSDVSDNSLLKKATLSALFTNAPNGGLTPAKLTNPYEFRAYLSGAHNSGNAAFAKLVFDAESFDTNTNFASGTYTVPVSGFYQVNWLVTSAASASTWIASLFKNGSEVARGNDVRTALNPNSSRGSDLLQLAAGDTIEVHIFGNSAIAIQTGGDRTYFSGFLVSQT